MQCDSVQDFKVIYEDPNVITFQWSPPADIGSAHFIRGYEIIAVENSTSHFTLTEWNQYLQNYNLYSDAEGGNYNGRWHPLPRDPIISKYESFGVYNLTWAPIKNTMLDYTLEKKNVQPYWSNTNSPSYVTIRVVTAVGRGKPSTLTRQIR